MRGSKHLQKPSHYLDKLFMLLKQNWGMVRVN